MSDKLKKVNEGNAKLAELAEKFGLNPEDALEDYNQFKQDVKDEENKKRKVWILGLVDATSSMNSVWVNTKSIITNLLKNMSQYGDISMQWIAYRDYDVGNRIIEKSGWTNDSGKLISFFEGIQCHGGYDWEEAVEVALKKAVEDQYSKTVFLIGDAPPHGNKDWKYQSEKLAQQGKKVYSFVVGGHQDTIEAFGKISKITGGACVELKSVNDIESVLSLLISKQTGTKNFNKTLEELKKKSGGKLPPHLDDFSGKLLGE